MKETKFKQTTVGRIPDDWKVKTLGEIGFTYSGLTGKNKQDFIKGNSLYITFLNVLTNPILKPELFEPVHVSTSEKQNKAHKGDLFFNTSSETPEEVGICSFLDKEIDDLYLNSFCFGYRLEDYNVAPLFLSYFFRSKEGRQLMTIAAQGVTRYNLSKTTFNKMRLALPPIKEQERIAGALTAADNLIASLDKQITKMRNIKQGTMQHLLSGKFPLPCFSESWTKKMVNDICITISPKIKLKTSDYKPTGKYPIIDQSQDLICGYTDIEESFPQSEYILFGDHTCCIKYADFPFVQGADGLKVLKTDNNSKFIYYALSNIKIETNYNRHWSILKKLTIPIPPLEEQERIASILTAMDNQLEALEAKRKKYEMVKQGMMQQLLTGNIRLV